MHSRKNELEHFVGKVEEQENESFIDDRQKFYESRGKSLKVNMISSFGSADLQTSVCHSGLELFGDSQMFVDFQRGYYEKVFPWTNSDAPVLEFELLL